MIFITSATSAYITLLKLNCIINETMCHKMPIRESEKKSYLDVKLNDVKSLNENNL